MVQLPCSQVSEVGGRWRQQARSKYLYYYWYMIFMLGIGQLQIFLQNDPVARFVVI
jgi:hypothetical protein